MSAKEDKDEDEEKKDIEAKTTYHNAIQDTEKNTTYDEIPSSQPRPECRNNWEMYKSLTIEKECGKQENNYDDNEHNATPTAHSVTTTEPYEQPPDGEREGLEEEGVHDIQEAETTKSEEPEHLKQNGYDSREYPLICTAHPVDFEGNAHNETDQTDKMQLACNNSMQKGTCDQYGEQCGEHYMRYKEHDGESDEPNYYDESHKSSDGKEDGRAHNEDHRDDQDEEQDEGEDKRSWSHRSSSPANIRRRKDAEREHQEREAEQWYIDKETDEQKWIEAYEFDLEEQEHLESRQEREHSRSRSNRSCSPAIAWLREIDEREHDEREAEQHYIEDEIDEQRWDEMQDEEKHESYVDHEDKDTIDIMIQCRMQPGRDGRYAFGFNEKLQNSDKLEDHSAPPLVDWGHSADDVVCVDRSAFRQGERESSRLVAQCETDRYLAPPLADWGHSTDDVGCVDRSAFRWGGGIQEQEIQKPRRTTGTRTTYDNCRTKAGRERKTPPPEASDHERQ